MRRVVTAVGSAAAVLTAAHAAVNAVLVRRPDGDPPPCRERVRVVIPARNEAHRIGDCLTRVLDQTGVPGLEVVVVDDDSTDATVAVVQAFADPRVRVCSAGALPPGWAGKPHACAVGARVADADVLVFLDADVALAPHAVAAGVAQLRALDVCLLSPFPRQLAGSAAEWLVQPMLSWGWLATVPLRWSERSTRPALAVACGQFMLADNASYRRAGGHALVAGRVIEDLGLARELRRAGLRTAVSAGGDIAGCRMYAGWDELREGYVKSLWSAFGTPLGAGAAHGAMTAAFVVPPLAALGGSPVGLVGYLAAVAGRMVAARVEGTPLGPAWTHPVGTLVTSWLTLSSLWRRRHGRLSWKGREL